MTFVGEHRDIIPHLHKPQIDQLPEMIRVDRKQCPLRLDVSKRPNEVDGPKGADSRYVAPSVIHYVKPILREAQRGGDRESPTEATLSWRGCIIEKLRNCGNELCGRERFSQKDAVGNALGGPFIGGGAGYVDDRKGRVDLSGLLRDFPTVHRAEQIDIRHERPVVVPRAPQQGHGFLA
jgi:hypothetical protein